MRAITYTLNLIMTALSANVTVKIFNFNTMHDTVSTCMAGNLPWYITGNYHIDASVHAYPQLYN